MSERVFWLHEDEWAMITLLPEENLSDTVRIRKEAEDFSKEHHDGFGWTSMYVIPEPQHPLATRRISLAEVRELVKDRLPEADRVETGIMPGEIQTQAGFAFGDEEQGALYGNEAQNGTVEYLHLIPPEVSHSHMEQFWIETLLALGTSHRLILVDWWNNAIIVLRNREQVRAIFDHWLSRK